MKKNDHSFIILTSEYPPGMFGGIAYWAKNLHDTLQKHGYFSIVLTAKSKTHRKLNVRSTSNVRYIGGHDWKKLHWFYRLPMLLMLLSIRKNIVIIAATWNELQVIHLLKPIFRFKLYCSSHGTDITRHCYPICKKNRKAINRAFSSVDLFIPVSYSLDHLARDLSKSLTCRSTVLGCNVDTDIFRPPASQEEKQRYRKLVGIDTSTPVIISVGRMLAVKGYRNIIMALPELRKIFPDILYVIVSQPLDPEYLLIRHLVEELNVSNHVRILTPVSHDELPQILHAADIFALLSEPVYFPYYQEEGLPRVIPEASACGLPVIVSTTGGLGEAVVDNKTGFIIKHGDITTLIKNIVTLLSDKKLAAEMGQQGRALVVKDFSVHAMTKKILGIVNNTP